MDTYSFSQQHEANPIFIILACLYYFIVCGLVASICQKRGHNFGSVLFYSILLSPIIAAILYAQPKDRV